MKMRIALTTTLILGLLSFTANRVNAEECVTPSIRTDLTSPTSLSVTGMDVSIDAMAELWRIVTTTSEPGRFLGRTIAQDQNWLDACEFPGIGLGAGSGYTPADKNVTIWFWGSGVDQAVARASVYVLIGQTPAPTTTITTTTTVAPTTTTTPATTTTLAPPDTTTSTTTSVPDVTTTTEPEVFITARVMSVSQLPVKASSVQIAVQQKKITKVTAKKKKVVTIKTTPKGKKKNNDNCQHRTRVRSSRCGNGR